MGRRKILWIAGAIALVAVLTLLGRRAADLIPDFAALVEASGVVGPLIFVVGYVAATIALVPGSLLTLAAGALFGLVRGTLLVFVAACIGATLAFLLARYLMRDLVMRQLGNDARFRSVDAAIAREGRKIVFLIRLSPLFPFNVTNYALGLTSVKLTDYVIACFGMLPGTVLYVYYGRLIGDVARVVAGAPVPRDTGYWAVLLLGLAATLLATFLITRAARRALGSSVGNTAV